MHLSYALWVRPFLKLIRDEPDGAEADLRQAIKVKRTLNDTLGLAPALGSLAQAALAKGDAERSATLLGGANTLWQTIGSARIGSEHLIARDQREKRPDKPWATTHSTWCRNGERTDDRGQHSPSPCGSEHNHHPQPRTPHPL